jgi:hypothetical protein
LEYLKWRAKEKAMLKELKRKKVRNIYLNRNLLMVWRIKKRLEATTKQAETAN